MLRPRSRAAVVATVLAAVLLAVAASPLHALAARPEVVHQQFAYPGADLGVVNICGDLADFRFWTEGSFTNVDMGDGVFHFQVASRGTYTVTFLDTSLGVWEATIRSATGVQATPGRAFVVADREYVRGSHGSTSRRPTLSVPTAPFTSDHYDPSMLRVVHRRRRTGPSRKPKRRRSSTDGCFSSVRAHHARGGRPAA
jgi:hypothetical protein